MVLLSYVRTQRFLPRPLYLPKMHTFCSFTMDICRVEMYFLLPYSVCVKYSIPFSKRRMSWKPIRIWTHITAWVRKIFTPYIFICVDIHMCVCYIGRWHGLHIRCNVLPYTHLSAYIPFKMLWLMLYNLTQQVVPKLILFVSRNKMPKSERLRCSLYIVFWLLARMVYIYIGATINIQIKQNIFSLFLPEIFIPFIYEL